MTSKLSGTASKKSSVPPLYHSVYLEKNEEEVKDFIQRLIQRLNPPPHARMLDAFCGKGPGSKMLAMLGFDVTGIDPVAGSITAAKEFETENMQFYIHDIRLPFWINYFNYAFCLFTGFGAFATRREHEDAIRTLSASLKPGGLLVLDYLNVHYEEENLVQNESISTNDTEYSIHRWDDEGHFYNRIKKDINSSFDSKEYTEHILKFSLGDFTEMLAYEGLQVQEVFGDYQFGRYDVRTKPRLILLASKKINDPEDSQKRIYSDGRANDPLT